jgi:hypothetical protein
LEAPRLVVTLKRDCAYHSIDREAPLAAMINKGASRTDPSSRDAALVETRL